MKQSVSKETKPISSISILNFKVAVTREEKSLVSYYWAVEKSLFLKFAQERRGLISWTAASDLAHLLAMYYQIFNYVIYCMIFNGKGSYATKNKMQYFLLQGNLTNISRRNSLLLSTPTSSGEGNSFKYAATSWSVLFLRKKQQKNTRIGFLLMV